MKTIRLIILAVAIVGFTSCTKEYTVVNHHIVHNNMMNYGVQIMQPDSTMKMIDSTMHIHVNFTEEDDKLIHHINVKIYQSDNPSNLIYDMPSDAHVMTSGGLHEHHDDLVLSAANGVIGHKNYTIEANVWGHEAGSHQVMATREFHIHQM